MRLTSSLFPYGPWIAKAMSKRKNRPLRVPLFVAICCVITTFHCLRGCTTCQSKSDSHSAAIICRIQLIEGPYLNEFLYWHLLVVNFQHVYFVNTEPHNIDRIRQSIDPMYQTRVTFLDLPVPAEKQDLVMTYLLGLVRAHVREKWILHIDADEFLVLPRQTPSIEDYIATSPKNIDVFTFRWIGVSGDDLVAPSMLAGFAQQNATAKFGLVYNSLGRIQNLVTMSHHFFTATGEVVRVPSTLPDNPVVLHFNPRSRLHTVLKVLNQAGAIGYGRDSRNSLQNVHDFLVSRDHPLEKYPPKILSHMYEVLMSYQRNVWKDEYTVAYRLKPAQVPASSKLFKEQFAAEVRAKLNFTSDMIPQVFATLESTMNPSRLEPLVRDLGYRIEMDFLRHVYKKLGRPL